MNFVSFSFLGLLCVVCVYRYTIGRVLPQRTYFGVLLAASLLFYSWHVPIYLAIILTSTTIDYVAGHFVAPRDTPRSHRRLVLTLSLLTNLGLLGFFKYAHFLAESLSSMTAYAGWPLDLPHFDIILPMGISFYTFQSMSYTIDVYRGRLPAARSFPRFLLYVSFFPQLMAGPIVRATDFLYQLDRRRRPRARVALTGAYLIVRGFFLKMVIADNLGMVVDAYWPAAAEPGAKPALGVLVTVMFGCQIFGDFAGYSSIARGVGYLLGFRLPVNFRSPYIAGSLREFWARWHISLSTWLRDYLYVPLGGNRNGTSRTLRNILIVMMLGGLWHGAGTTYILWGTAHGVVMAIERLVRMDRPSPRVPHVVRFGWYVGIQVFILLTWFLFRAENVAQASALLRNVCTLSPSAWSWWPSPAEFPVAVFCLGVVPTALHHVRSLISERWPALTPTILERTVVAGGMAYAVLTCFGVGQQFIYFQF